MIELLRLRRPLFGFTALILVAIVLVLFSITQAAAHRQWTRVEEALNLLQSAPDRYCVEFGIEAPSSACEDFLREERKVQEQYRLDTIERFPLVAAQQDALGVGGIAAGFVTTAPGAVAMMAMAAGYIGGEWNRRTMALLLARDPRRLRMVFLRFVVVWLMGLATLAITWIGLIAVLPLFRFLYHLPPPPGGVEFSTFALEQVLKAAGVLGVYAALGTAAAFIAKNAFSAFLAGAFVLALAVAVSPVAPWHRLSAAYLVGQWMGFAPANLLVDHLWVDAFPGPPPSDLMVGLGMIATIAVALALAAIIFRRTTVPA